MAKTLAMTEGKPSKLLLQFAIPLMIGNLFQQAYTLADRVIVGQFVGADAYSAVGATTALTNLFMSVCMGMSIGAGVVVAQYFGAKDEENTASAIINSAYICVSQAIAAVLCLTYAYKKVPYMKMAVKHLKPNKKLIVQTMKVGLPTGVQYSLMYVSTIVLQSVVNGFGESTIGAFTSVSQMELLVQQIYAGLGTSMVTYTGQNIGAGKVDRVKLGMRSAMKICAILSVILLAIFWLGGNLIMTILVPDEEIISISATGIRITSLFFMALGTVQITRYLLNGAGDSIYSMMNGGIEIVARITFVFILTSIPFIGMWGIFIATGLTWLVTALFALWRYKKGAWINKSLV